MKELIARLEALKDHVWTPQNTGVAELKDKFTELVDIIHKAITQSQPPPPPQSGLTPRNAAPK